VGEKGARGGSIATQVTLFTLVAVTLSVVLIGVVSLTGVYRLALAEDESRLGTHRDLLAEGIGLRLDIVARAVEPMGTDQALLAADTRALAQTLAREQAARDEYLEMLVVADSAGRVLAASESSGAPATFADAAFFAPLLQRGDLCFAWEPASGPSPGRLWAVYPVKGAQPPGRVLVARVRTGSIDAVLRSDVEGEPDRAAAIVDKDGRLVMSASSGATLASGSLRFVPEPDSSAGRVEVGSAGESGVLAGFYGAVSVAPELGWRVLVVEPQSMSIGRARTALWPAGLATAIVCLLAVVVALIYSRRIVAPLSAFERRARDIAQGGYVRPLVLARSDEIGRLADAFNAMGVRLNSLQDMAQLLASASEVDDVLDSVLAATGHLIGTADTAILLAEDDGERLTLARGRGLRVPELAFEIPVGEPSPVTTAFRERRPVVFEGQSARWAYSVFRLFDADRHRSGVVVPLVVGDDALGVIVALSPGRHRLTQAQVETLRAFSAHAGVAIRTSRLFEHERRSRTEAEALREAAELVVSAPDMDDAIERVAAVAAALLDMTGRAVAIDDREEFGMNPAPDPAAERALLDLWSRSAGDPASRGSVYEPVVVPRGGELFAEGGESGPVLLVPLVRDDAVRGVVALSGIDSVEMLGERELATAAALGRQVSLALDNAALLQEARSRAANLETIFRISQAVSSSLQINVVLNRVLDVVQKIFSADAVSLMAYDPAQKTLITSMARGVANRELLYLQVAPGQDVPGEVFRTHTAVHHPDLSIVDTPLGHLATAQGLHSLVTVPLLARGRSVGVINVLDQRPDAFSAQDVELLLTFASQAAIAIDTAEMYSREHHVASVLQSSILPERLPDMPGIEADSFYLPAGTEAEIGGDYYDLFWAEDGTIVVAIGDVCGKGVTAATKTSMIKYTLRGMVAAGAGPAQALSELNRLIAGTGDPSDIVTAWVGFIDLERRVLRYADGGHPPALLHRRGGESPGFERLSATGPLLGAVAAAKYGECEVAFGPGDLLVAYTDGVTEARSGRRFFGEGRIRRVMLHSRTAAEVVDGLLAAVGAFSAGVMRDDAAVLAVRLIDAPGEAAAPEIGSEVRGVDSDATSVQTPGPGQGRTDE
jgi:serine phosphatase RsbU (regulator of sigma subunit)/putative methionine-R-sulfoxide reductase with GAF domain/HAMP domain-containing protein